MLVLLSAGFSLGNSSSLFVLLSDFPEVDSNFDGGALNCFPLALQQECASIYDSREIASACTKRRPEISRQPPEITGEDAHHEEDSDHPYRTMRSPFSTLVDPGARNRSGAKPPVARGCP